MWDWGAIRLGYHDHYVVDDGKARIILAALVTSADVMESQAMRDLLWRVCFRRKLRPHHVTGDAKYGTTENIVDIEDAGIRAHLPLTDFEHRSALYGRDAFTYDPERDQYCCPQGHPLPLARHKRTEAVVVYRADPAICNVCPIKERCTTRSSGVFALGTVAALDTNNAIHFPRRRVPYHVNFGMPGARRDRPCGTAG
jgi:hypothetical protein